MTAPSHASARRALAVDDLTLAHRGRAALIGLTGRFEPGVATAVIGPNGAGKSTLLAALAGQLRPASGQIRRDPCSRVAYLPQQAAFDRSFPVSVHDLVAMGLWPRLGAWRRIDASHRALIDAALLQVGLADAARRPVAELSAGQWQRALFARLLLQDADVILLDEPFNAVDEQTTADLLALLAQWVEQGRTVIAVLHDLAQVRRHFDQTLILSGQRCRAWGPTAEVLGTVEPSAAAAWLNPSAPWLQAA